MHSYKKNTRYSLALAFLSLALLGNFLSFCSPSKNSPSSNTANTAQNQGGKKKVKNDYFKDLKTYTAAERQAFLDTTHCVTYGSQPSCWFNTKPNASKQPSSLVVHAYGTVSVAATLVIKLPVAFHHQIPLDIKTDLEAEDIDTLELFLTAQQSLKLNGLPDTFCLKPAYWVFPNINAETYTGNISKTVWMKIYNSDATTNIENPRQSEKDISFSKLQMFNPHLHNKLVSPNEGFFSDTFPNQAVNPNFDSFSFYSIGILREERKAIVTLHWMINLPVRDSIIRPWINKTVNASLAQFLTDMDSKPYIPVPTAAHTATHALQGALFMEKLKELVKP